jgi:signal transduction histidine kinase/ActR/RegA family two-component response regulator/putative methionine-R-sulfoxide reductase with GAF domain
LREPLLLATERGIIVASNVAAADALGTSVSALEGVSLSTFSVDRQQMAAQLDAVRAGGATTPFPLLARDGRRFFCDARELEAEMLLLRLSGGPEPELRLRGFGDALSRLDKVIVGEGADVTTFEETIKTLFGLAMVPLGANAAGLFVLDPTGTNLELKASIGYRDAYVDRFRMVPLAAELPITDAVKRSVPVLIATLEECAARYPELARNHPVIAQRPSACVPLASQGRTIGVIGMGFPVPSWAFSDDDRALLAALAQSCARIIEQGRVVESEQTPRKHAATPLSRLHAFTGALAQAISWTDVVEVVVDMAMSAAGARTGGLWMISADGAAASLLRSVGPVGPTPEHFTNVPLDAPARMPMLDTIRSGTPIWIESCNQMEESYPAVAHVFAKSGQESSLACLPLFAQGRCIGGLSLNYEGVRRFDDSERAFLQVVAWHSAQALERSRLYAAEKSERAAAEASERRSKFLANAGTILASSLDLGSTLSSVARAAVPGVADWCIVELADEWKEGLPAVVAHIDSNKEQFVRDLSRRFRQLGDPRGIPGVIRSGKTELHPKIDVDVLREALVDDPELAELYGQTGITSAMVVPMSARGVTLGAILLVSARQERLYGPEDVEMAEELGRRAGIAVDNARLYREARQADRLKDEFLAMLGHELRNPLSPIVTALELMTLSGSEAFKRERTIISRQVQHMTRLVDDLLDVSRVMRGKIHLEKRNVEVGRIVTRAVEVASPLLEQRQHHLSLTVAPHLPVHADEGRLAQAIANLLNNAAKYTEAGGRIHVSAALEGAEVCVRVRDSGVGIAKEVLPTVFDLFVQAKGAIDRAQGGLGIGLAIVKRLVELHGGKVSAHSDGAGLGSEFIVHLPLAQGKDEAPAGVDRARQRPMLGAAACVLVVDDNIDFAQTLADTLESVGCVTRVANDGPSALALAESFHPDLALVDIGLPVMDGYELARRFRKVPTLASVRLVAVTGYGQAKDRQQSQAAGFDEHVVKPIQLEIIREILARLSATGDHSR